MRPQSVTASAPGKLYIAGEYAVVEPGHQAILIGVDRFVTATLTARAGTTGRITSHAAPGPLEFSLREELLEFSDDPTGFYRYLIAALRITETLRAERDLPACAYDLEITSALHDAATGAKLGLGSSGAVTVAAISAVAQFHDLHLSPVELYRLAMLATITITQSTSGGDIAASALGGWVHYASPDRAWLAQQRTTRTITELLAAEWPGLDIRRIETADGGTPQVEIRVGWTGEPADTPLLVDHARRHTPIDAVDVLSSDEIVGKLEEALVSGEFGDLDRTVEKARALLGKIASTRGTEIETPELQRLITEAVEAGWSAKSSGAGGGDCGIALAKAGKDDRELIAAWEKAGITALSITVSTTRGAA